MCSGIQKYIEINVILSRVSLQVSSNHFILFKCWDDRRSSVNSSKQKLNYKEDTLSHQSSPLLLYKSISNA